MIEEQFGIVFGATLWNEPSGSSLAKHMHDTRIVLNQILRSRAGHALAASLRFHTSLTGPLPASNNNKWILLLPYEVNDCNAEEFSLSNSPKPVVLFSPAKRGSGCSNGEAATLPHEVLYHELAHALREISGHLHKHEVINKLVPYTNTEEFLAVLATNIFISDVTNHWKTSLRADHISNATLDPALADSFRFFSLGIRTFNVISTFCNENHGFTRMLATVSAPFNPIAAYYENRQKALDMAADGDAGHIFDDSVPLNWVKGPAGTWQRTNPNAGVPSSWVKGPGGKWQRKYPPM